MNGHKHKMLEYISAPAAAEKWGISERRIQKLCEENRIPGVAKFCRMWLIPKDVKNPIDGRLRSQKQREESVMKIAICDDDISVLSSITAFINKTYHDIDILVDRYSSGESLLNSLEKEKHGCDLLLLDIEMNGIDGLQVAKKIHMILPEVYIVFITSHEEFALTGYEVAAFRFLTKPIQAQKLAEAITTVKQELLNLKTIQIEFRDISAILKVKDIFYIEAQDKYVKIVRREQIFYDRNGIDYYTDFLQFDDYYRIHRSYLINMRHVTFISRCDVQMMNGEKIPISRLRKKQFDEAFQAYVKRTAR